MRRVRELYRILRMTLRLDPWRATVVMLPVIPLFAGFLAVGARGFIVAADHGDRGGVLVAALAAAVGVGGTFVAIYWQVATGGMRLSEVTGAALDRRLMGSMLSSPTVALFDDADVLDRVELIRVNKQALATPVALVRDLCWTGGNLVVGTLLLAAVDVRLAVLGALIVPTAWVYFRAEDISDRAERSMAGTRREALHLYDVGTGPDEGKEVRVLGQADTIRARYRSAWGEVDRTLTSAYTKAALVRIVTFGVVTAVAAVVLVGVVRDLGQRRLDAVDALLLVLGITGIADAAGFAGFVASSARRALHVVDHYLTILDRVPVHSGHSAPPTRLQQGISLEGVSFAYPGQTEPVLVDLDVRFEAGTTVAIVGANGAGKSTLVKLLCGLYDPTEGTVKVDGADLRGLDRHAWAGSLALVAQDHARFELLARETVGIGDIAALDDEMVVAEAVQRAGAAPVVDTLADGLATQLGSRFGGRDLSGGQWQRLAVARGMMRRTPLLLALDEPTGALDARTEQELLQRCVAESRELAEVAGTVVVYVSHRYATVRLADRILVFDDGRIVEDGSHTELLAAHGHYADLYRRQAQAYA